MPPIYDIIRTPSIPTDSTCIHFHYGRCDLCDRCNPLDPNCDQTPKAPKSLEVQPRLPTPRRQTPYTYTIGN